MEVIESRCSIFRVVCNYENKLVFLGNSYDACGVNSVDLVTNIVDLISS